MRKLSMLTTLLLLGLLAVALPILAIAETVTITWQKPVANVDNSTPANVQGYNLYTGRTEAEVIANKAARIKFISGISGADNLSREVTITNVGMHYFAADAWSCAQSPCVESGLSAILAYEVKAVPPPNPVPLPPVLLTIDTVAMSTVPDYSRLAFVPSKVVGTVALGVVCDPKRQAADGYAGIPLSFVTWSVSPSLRPANVIARCSL